MTQNTSHAVMAQRHEAHDSLDDFPTPPWAVRALMEYVIGKPHGTTCWEPACNRGYMVRPLREYFTSVYASDVHDYGWKEQDAVVDFLLPGFEPPQIIDWIITNPPFRLAQQFAERALYLRPTQGFALLTRTAFLEGGKRYEEMFSVFPPVTVAQFVERVPMVKGRHDPDASTATAYCWIVWRPAGLNVPTEFVWIPPCRRQLQKPHDAPPQQGE